MSDSPPSESPGSRATGRAPASTSPSSVGAGSPTGPSSGAGGDWTVVVAGRIEAVVTTLRDQTTEPVTKIARAVVFGFIIVVMSSAAVVLGVIGVLRLHVYLPFQPEGRRVWVTYVGLGAIFMLVGAFFWRKSAVRTKE
jgi:hypothetical protein